MGAQITTFPSSANIVPEPFGVVLIISAWNYPFRMYLIYPFIYLLPAIDPKVVFESSIGPPPVIQFKYSRVCQSSSPLRS